MRERAGGRERERARKLDHFLGIIKPYHTVKILRFKAIWSLHMTSNKRHRQGNKTRNN